MPAIANYMFVIDWSACIKCGACVAVCPLEAGFTSAFDTISIEKPCGVTCMACERVCPVSAISHRPATPEERLKTVAQLL